MICRSVTSISFPAVNKPVSLGPALPATVGCTQFRMLVWTAEATMSCEAFLIIARLIACGYSEYRPSEVCFDKDKLSAAASDSPCSLHA